MLRPPYAPSANAEWFIGWGLRFPDGGSGWDGADPRLRTMPHAIVAVGASGVPAGTAGSALLRRHLPQGWSAISGEAASLAASRPLLELPTEPDARAAVLAGWTSARIDELRSFLRGW